VFLLHLNHAAVLNAILKGPENLKKRKVMGRKKNAIRRNKPKVAKKMQRKLKRHQLNYQANLKKSMFMMRMRKMMMMTLKTK